MAATGASFLISGRVQGVSFRAYTRAKAVRLGLVGQVRNLPTGQVEALAWGEETSLEAFRQWLSQGSPGSQVTGIQDSPWQPANPLSSFEVVF